MSRIPEDVTSIRLVVNGIQCFQQGHDGQPEATIHIGENDLTPTLARGCLQVYAINENSTILATASAPNPFLVNDQPRGDLDGPGRVVGSALQSPTDVHRWEFVPILDHGVPVAQLSVVFDMTPHDMGHPPVIATVKWILGDLGEEWGTVTNTADIGNGVYISRFNPLFPEGWNGKVQCEVAAAPGCVDELRYAIYREMFNVRKWCAGAAVPLPSAKSTKVSLGKKVAVLVGVSKYTRRPKKRMSDLEYADDDIVQWYHYLRKLGFECKVFGDEFSPWTGQNIVCMFRSAHIHDGMVQAPCATSVRRCVTW